MKLLLWLSLPLLIIDQVTKFLIYKNFDAPSPYFIDEVPVIDGFFYLHRVHNTGIAFGTFNGGTYANLVFGFIAAAALILLFWFSRKNAFPTRVGKVAVALLVAGILGNLSDRIFYGYVVDFLSFDLHFSFTPPWSDHPFGPRFASFNVADACISIAAVLLFIAAFQHHPHSEEAPPDPERRLKTNKPSMAPSKGFLVGIAAVIIVGLIATTFLYRVYAGIPEPEWDRIKAKIRKDFPGVPETTTAKLAEAMARGASPILIDSREKDEFDVSHLPGAIHATTVEKVKKIAAPDAEIVVYCSVGYRSGKLVAALRESGFTKAKNLEGSIFAWANEDRPLVRDGDEKATTVHPYSRRWGELLDVSKRHPTE